MGRLQGQRKGGSDNLHRHGPGRGAPQAVARREKGGERMAAERQGGDGEGGNTIPAYGRAAERDAVVLKDDRAGDRGGTRRRNRGREGDRGAQAGGVRRGAEGGRRARVEDYLGERSGACPEGLIAAVRCDDVVGTGGERGCAERPATARAEWNSPERCAAVGKRNGTRWSGAPRRWTWGGAHRGG